MFLPKPPKRQAGYIGLMIIVFLLILSMLLYPYVFPVSEGPGCIVGNDPKEPKELTLPGIKDLTTEPGTGKGGPSGTKAKFILIRENVPVYDGIYFFAENDSPPNEHAFRVIDPSMPDYVFYYPGQWNHFNFHRKVKPTNTTKDDPNNNNLAYRQEGLVVAVQTDGQGNEKIETDPRTGRPARIADYYQIEDIYNAQKDYQTEELFYCTEELPDTGPATVLVPNQRVSQARDQLQLEWFVFKYGSGMVYPHCKPAIYLYPEKKQFVNVKVFPKGELTLTDPPYDRVSGWNIEANPTGALFAMNNEPITNNYLYYESRIRDAELRKPEEGWVVTKQKSNIKNQKDIEELLNEILPKLGLNNKEAVDFKSYWLTKLPDSPYYFVGLVNKQERDYIEPLAVTPVPDTSIRFSLYFEALDRPRAVTEPKINTPARKGFTLVDWGGLVKLHPGTPFTCSQ